MKAASFLASSHFCKFVGNFFPDENNGNVQQRGTAMPNDASFKILTTTEAAKLLNRKPQTLRKWACHENGPIKPLRVNGRLAWKAQDIRALIHGGDDAN